MSSDINIKVETGESSYIKTEYSSEDSEIEEQDLAAEQELEEAEEELIITEEIKKQLALYKPGICDYCSRMFLSKEILTAHIQEHMRMKSNKRTTKNKQDPKGHTCRTCGQSFLYIGKLERHTKSHSGMNTVCVKCLHVFYSDGPVNLCFVCKSDKKKVISKESGPVACPVCNKIFQSASKLNYHSIVHNGVKSFKCLTCEKSFYRSYELKRHEQSHSQLRQFLCTTCGRAYSHKAHLKVHQMTHSGEKNFHCTVCDKTFFRKSELDRHEKVHTGDKPHQCEICSKSFIQKNNLVMHMKVHTNDRPHQCEVCLKSFITRSKLNIHFRKHQKKLKFLVGSQ